MPDRIVEAPDLQVLRHAARPRVVLAGLPPVYAQGLRLVLHDSTAECTVLPDPAQLPARLPAVLAGPHPLVVVVPAEAAAEVLSLVGPTAGPAAPRSAVVVLLEEATLEACAQALRAGATGVITAADAAADVVTVLRCAGQGRTVLARELVQALCRPRTVPPPALTAAEQGWLRRLAAGATVAGLARAQGYSEREMYRRLSAVYQQLGARTRTEALLAAERFGLLAQPT